MRNAGSLPLVVIGVGIAFVTALLFLSAWALGASLALFAGAGLLRWALTAHLPRERRPRMPERLGTAFFLLWIVTVGGTAVLLMNVRDPEDGLPPLGLALLALGGLPPVALGLLPPRRFAPGWAASLLALVAGLVVATGIIALSPGTLSPGDL